MTSETEAREALPAGLTLSEDGSLLNWRGENYVIQRPPLPAPSEDERERREAASQAVVTSATQILGHSLNERGNSVARQYADAAIDAYLASRPTPPEDVAALIADRDTWKRMCAEETLAWVAATKRADEAEAALTARTASQSPSDLELPVETPSAVGASEGVTDDALLATLEEHYLVPQEDLDRDYERASLIRGLRAVAALAARPLPETEQWEYASALVAPDGTYWDEEITSLAEARRHVAECDGEDHDDPCVVVKRTPERPAGTWLPVPSADLGEEKER